MMRQRFVAIVLLGSGLLTDAAAQGYAPGTTAAERLQLPKYCWAQYIDKNYSGNPEYSITGCGVGMNHFCPGLIYLIRAQKVSNPPKVRAENAGGAIAEFNYTKRAMTPDCRLRADVDAALAKAKAIQASVK